MNGQHCLCKWGIVVSGVDLKVEGSGRWGMETIQIPEDTLISLLRDTLLRCVDGCDDKVKKKER